MKPGYPVKATDLSQVRQTLSRNVVLNTPLHERNSNVVIDTDCTGSCEPNYFYDHDLDGPTIEMKL